MRMFALVAFLATGLADPATANGLWRAVEVEVSAFDPVKTATSTPSPNAFRLISSHPEFGGFSGADWHGDWLYLVSDRGTLWRAAGQFDQAGDLSGLTDWHFAEVDDPKRKATPDLEAISFGPQERVFVAIEGRHTIFELIQASDRFVIEPRLPIESLSPSPINRGVETLAFGSSGEFAAISEGALRSDGRHAAVFVGFDGQERAWGHPSATNYDPTDADWNDDGELYVLERRFGLLSGWQAKITAMSNERGTETRVVRAFSHDLVMDNFEGLAIRHQGSRTHATIVSDDNFFFVQSTLIYDFPLPR